MNIPTNLLPRSDPDHPRNWTAARRRDVTLLANMLEQKCIVCNKIFAAECPEDAEDGRCMQCYWDDVYERMQTR